MSDTSTLTQLGSQNTQYPTEPSIDILETFENQHQDNIYLVPIEYIRFTSLCPKTGQPDGADIYINYIPNKRCVESKSLKLYFVSYRNHGSFMEDINLTVIKDLIQVLDPLYIEVYTKFVSRGDTFVRPYSNHYKHNSDTETDKNINRKIDNILNRYHVLQK